MCWSWQAPCEVGYYSLSHWWENRGMGWLSNFSQASELMHSRARGWPGGLAPNPELHHENTLPHPPPIFPGILSLATQNKAVATTPPFRAPSPTSFLCLSLGFLPWGWIWDPCENFPAWLSQSQCRQLRQWLINWMCPQRPHAEWVPLWEPAPGQPVNSAPPNPFWTFLLASCLIWGQNWKVQSKTRIRQLSLSIIIRLGFSKGTQDLRQFVEKWFFSLPLVY